MIQSVQTCNACYGPEGTRIGLSENREMLLSSAGLERAIASGRILEAMAVMCDGDMTLTVDLGCMRGIIRREEVAWCPEGESVRDIAVITRVGKAVCFRVLSIEKDASGMPYAILSRRAAQIECLHAFLEGLIPGDIIPAKVTHLEHFGAFVDIGCGIVSLLSIDCISVSRISHPKDRFHVGMFLRVIVKSMDYREDGGLARIYVSHKELLGSWQENAALFSVGQTVAGIVRSVEEYGIFVELTPNLAGLAEYREDVSAGQTAAVYIKSILPERMKIKLVLIDTYRGEILPQHMDYYLDSRCEGHMDRWRYSPPGSARVLSLIHI